MTDGPFRNTGLSSRWKQYGKDLESDATSQEERIAQACYSMFGDLHPKVFSSLLSALQKHTQRPQLDLDPIASLEQVFESRPTSPLTSAFQKHLTANIRDKMPFEAAVDQAVTSTARDWISSTKNRLNEECIRARDLGDMSREKYGKALKRNQESFAAIDPSVLCAALISGDKRTFKRAIQRRAGVDQGPDE